MLSPDHSEPQHLAGGGQTYTPHQDENISGAGTRGTPPAGASASPSG